MSPAHRSAGQQSPQGQLVPPQSTRTTGYIAFIVLLAFAAWALVSMDNVMLGLAVPALAPAMHLSLSDLEYLVGVFAFVTFAAPVLAGRIIDRRGRRVNFQVSLIGTGVFGGVTALVSSAWQFIVVRLLVATSYGLTEPVINTLVAEEAPRRHRGILMGFVQAGYPLGAAIAGTIASALLAGPGWRPLFLISFAPLLLVIVAGLFLKDSSRFEQVQEAVKARDVEHKPDWRQLFTREQRRQTVVTSLFGFCVNGGIGLVIGVVTTYLTHVDHMSITDATFLFGLSNWVALGSQILVGWLADYLPSKWLMTVYAVVAAASLALLAIPGLTFTTAAISLVAFGFFGNGTFGCYTRYTTESYPTELRGTGTSFSLGFSFLTLSFMPIIGGALIESGTPAVIPVISAALVLCGAVVMACGKKFPPRRDLDELAPSRILGETA